MAHLNKANYGSAIKKNFQTASALGLVCETKKKRSSIIPVSGTSGKCGNRLLMKTLFVTVVNHRTRTVITKEGDRLYPSSGDRSRYLLIP